MADSFPLAKQQQSLIGTGWDGVKYYVSNTLHGENISATNRRAPDGVYRSGSSWLMYKTETLHYGSSVRVVRGQESFANYTGRFYVTASQFAFSNNDLGDKTSQLNNAKNFGAKAYAALKPDLPDFSAASSLYELKESFNPLHQRAKDKFRESVLKRNRLMQERHWSKHAADQYVTYWFGWLPLISDAVNFAVAFDGRKKRFDQLLRDEGRLVHRERNLETGTNVSNTTVHTPGSTGWNLGLQPKRPDQCYVGSPGASGGSTTDSSHTRTWCSGSSKYLLPPGPRDDVWKKVLLNRILGWRSGKPTFQDLYAVMPWSWFVDYFSGVGDWIDATAPGIADRVWFEYAYVMQTTEKAKSVTLFQTVRTGGPNTAPKSNVVSSTGTKTLVRKTRVTASPFGFGLDTPSLKQMSILGALGYSALPPLR